MYNRLHLAMSSLNRAARAHRTLVITIGVLCALAIDFELLEPTAQAQTQGRINVGTWNTMLQPWFPYEADVIKTIAATDFEVLALQEVWTEAAKNRIVSDPAVSAKYGYHYYAPARQAAAWVPAFVIRDVQEDYIRCLVASGIDTRTIEQPSAPISLECQMLALQITFTSPLAVECLINTMQQLGPAVNPLTAVDICGASNGVRYSHGGRPGLLILSKSPLQDLDVVTYDTFLIRRAVVYATVSGTRFGFTHFPTNYLEDINPILAPFQSGALQTQLVQDIIARGPDVIVGDFNSGPDYQPEAHAVLVQNGYTPLFARATFCPLPSHTLFPQCQPPTGPFSSPPAPRSIDNIYIKGSAADYRTGLFAENAVSDHIGLSAASTTAPPIITVKPGLSLFPPNHKYTTVTISQMVKSATDDYDGNLLGSVVIEKVTSDEADNAPGDADGNTVADMVIAPGCKSVQLRVERDENKNGRVYVVTLRLRDSSGNTVWAEYNISVPVSQNGKPALQGAAAETVSSSCP